MPVEMKVPFALTPEGGIAIESNPDRQVASHIRVLVSTNPGERVMLPDYGVPLAGLLFEPGEDLVEAEITDLVTAALARWEPGAFVHSVTPVPDDEGYGVASVQVHFTRTESASSPDSFARKLNTATITVGGDVREQIIG